MRNATKLNLINEINEKTGASVGMYAGIDCAPIEWSEFFASKPELCKNAFAGSARWFCYDYNGNRTPGKEKLVLGTCEICRTAESDGELPSFLRNDDEE